MFFIIYFIFSYGLAQNHKPIEQEKFDSLYKLHRKELQIAPKDTVLKRAHTLVYYIDHKKQLDSISMSYKKYFLKKIMQTHYENRAKDSMQFYFDLITRNYTDNNFLSSVYLYKASFSYLDGDVEESLINYNKALALAKESGDPYGEINILINLANLYIFSKRNDLALEMIKRIESIIFKNSINNLRYNFCN